MAPYDKYWSDENQPKYDENVTEGGTIPVTGNKEDDLKNSTQQLEEDKKEFEAYKTKRANSILSISSDSDTCIQLIEQVKNSIIGLTFCEQLSLEENKASVDRVVNELNEEIKDLRSKEEKQKRETQQNEENSKSFEFYKEKQKERIQYMPGSSDTCLRLKDLATIDIDKQLFDYSLDLNKNKEAVDSIISKLETDLKRYTSMYEVAKEWVKEHRKWCFTVLSLFILSLTLIGLWSTREIEPLPSVEAISVLESKSWSVTMMDGKTVNESATISSSNVDKTLYNIRIVTQYGKVEDLTFSVDWQTGKVISRQMGEGNIVKNKRAQEIIIEFEKWTFTQGY